MNDIVFTCKLCGREHPATELLDSGVAKLPDTITTEQNNKKEWYFKCIECNKLLHP